MQAGAIGPTKPAQHGIVKVSELGRDPGGRRHVREKETPAVFGRLRLVEQLERLFVVPLDGQGIGFENRRLHGIRLEP